MNEKENRLDDFVHIANQMFSFDFAKFFFLISFTRLIGVSFVLISKQIDKIRLENRRSLCSIQI